MIGLHCSNCGRSLLRAYAGEGYRIYGPTCAAKLGINPAASSDLPPRPLPTPKPSRKVRRARSVMRRAVAQWGQMRLELVL